MSEYQYYEFQAIDRPLDEDAMDELRSLSSRAEITRTSFVNEYNNGSFRGNADKVLERYFDAHLYVANWGTHRLACRLPARSFSLAAAEVYQVEGALKVRATKDHVIVDFESQIEGGGWEEGGEYLDPLLPLRADLLAGDLRCLYLGWLSSTFNKMREVDEAAIEPPVPPGLKQLTGPLRSFVEYMRLDPDLVEAAAMASADGVESDLSKDAMAAWVARLPREESDAVLVRLMQGEGNPLAGELMQRFRNEQSQSQSPRDGDVGEPRRTVAELITLHTQVAEENERLADERAAKEEAKKAREKAAARVKHIETLMGREKELWKEMEEAINTKLPKKYDHAAELLRDLCDLADRTGKADEVKKRVLALRDEHRGKRTLIQRFDKAGVPK